MPLHLGDVEWVISDPPGKFGLIYHTVLNEKNALQRVEELIPDIKKGIVPSLWFITPESTPQNLKEILKSKGFNEIEINEPEPGMVISLQENHVWPDLSKDIVVKRIKSVKELQEWIDIVNEILFGYKMFEVEKFYPFINVENMAFYIMNIGDNPVGTSMYIQDGDKASIEFIATSQTSRNRGVGTAAVVTVLHELLDKGVKTATLRSRYDAIEFYKK